MKINIIIALIAVSITSLCMIETDESEHMECEFWQKSSGEYCMKSHMHQFVFDDLEHDPNCPCNSIFDKMFDYRSLYYTSVSSTRLLPVLSTELLE